MGSMFTKYKSPALVNLDWTTTFTPELLRKDLDLGLALGREMDVPMPVTAATREVLQSHFGAATLQKDPDAYLQKDFAALVETMALAAGMKLESGKQERADRAGEAERRRTRKRVIASPRRGPVVTAQVVVTGCPAFAGHDRIRLSRAKPYGFAMCQAPLRKPSPVMSPGFLSFFQV